MKNKGFTLVELLATVFILALVLGMAIYGVSNVIGQKQDESFEDSKKGIREGTKTFIASSTNCEIEEGQKVYICLKTLIDNGYYTKVTKIKGNNATCDGYISYLQNKVEEDETLNNYDSLIEVETYLKCGQDFIDVPEGKSFSEDILQRCQNNTENTCLK